jgi:hypothetical protein
LIDDQGEEDYVFASNVSGTIKPKKLVSGFRGGAIM